MIHKIDLRNSNLGLYLKISIICLFIVLSFTVTFYYSFTYIVPILLMLFFKVDPSRIYKITLVFITCLIIPSLLSLGILNILSYFTDTIITISHRLLLCFTFSSIVLLNVCIIKVFNKTVKTFLLILINEKDEDIFSDIRMLHLLFDVRTIRVFYYITYFIYSIVISYITLFYIGVYNFKQITAFSYSFTMFFAYDRILKELAFYDYRNLLKLIKKGAF